MSLQNRMSINNNNKALMASPTADFQEAWFLDTDATHHISKEFDKCVTLIFSLKSNHINNTLKQNRKQ